MTSSSPKPKQPKDRDFQDRDFQFFVAKLDREGKLRPERGKGKYFTLDLGNNIGLDMVNIKGGTFKMGSTGNEDGRGSDETQIDYPVKTFYMSRYLITQVQWEKVAKLPKVDLDLSDKPSTFDEKELNKRKLPVETISWEEAQEFCKRLSQKFEGEYKLPSEAQWEYACRANTTTPFYCGETITPEVANYDCHYSYGRKPPDKTEIEQYKGETVSVEFIQRTNNFGLNGMCGNLWEWCEDIYFSNYEEALNYSDSSLKKNRLDRVIRGGAWNSFPASCRSAKRNSKPQDIKMNTIGFRVVCTF
ncbi:MAG: formylglycine-generating enzyme family protein [Okeania sp. SIO3C4]|nr:formylglycine-generating enzyme family protein [Okeania sp. SIO3C4]